MSLSPYTLLAQGVYSGLLNAFNGATYTAGKVMAMSRSENERMVSLILTRLDLENKISVLKSLIELFSLKEKHELITQCLISLEQVISNIQSILSDIERKQLKHLNKWFRKWRSINLEREIEILHTYAGVLEDRFKYMMNINEIIRV